MIRGQSSMSKSQIHVDPLKLILVPNCDKLKPHHYGQELFVACYIPTRPCLDCRQMTTIISGCASIIGGKLL